MYTLQNFPHSCFKQLLAVMPLVLHRGCCPFWGLRQQLSPFQRKGGKMCIDPSQLDRFCVSNSQGACVCFLYSRHMCAHLCPESCVCVCAPYPPRRCVHVPDLSQIRHVGMQKSAPQNLMDVSVHVPTLSARAHTSQLLREVWIHVSWHPRGAHRCWVHV